MSTGTASKTSQRSNVAILAPLFCWRMKRKGKGRVEDWDAFITEAIVFTLAAMYK